MFFLYRKLWWKCVQPLVKQVVKLQRLTPKLKKEDKKPYIFATDLLRMKIEHIIDLTNISEKDLRWIRKKATEEEFRVIKDLWWNVKQREESPLIKLWEAMRNEQESNRGKC